MSKPRGEMPRKQPFKLVRHKLNSSGMMVAMIEDIDAGLFYIGVGLTVDNLNDSPYGCRTYYDEDEAEQDYHEVY